MERSVIASKEILRSGFVDFLKHVRATSTVYIPGSKSSMRASPSRSASAVREAPDDWFVMTILASGMTAPAGSFTTTRRPPPRLCGRKRPGDTMRMRAPKTNVFSLIAPPHRHQSLAAHSGLSAHDSQPALDIIVQHKLAGVGALAGGLGLVFHRARGSKSH